MKMTMRELAKLANVSVSAVSKAFNGADDINAETRERIFGIAKQTGCYYKFYKGKYPKKIIAIICQEIIGNFYVEFVDRLRKQIEASNNIALVVTDDFSASKQEELIDYFSSYLKVDGIIVFGLRSELKKNHNTPIISLFSSIDDKVDSINIDFNAAINDAVSLLWDYGHRNIAFLSESLTKAKAQTFASAMCELGVTDATVIESEKRFEVAGKDCAEKLILSNPDCTAVICAYDNIALGAIKQFKTAGLSVPEDISVIGIDNITTGKYAQTSLTTIGVDTESICALACDILQKKLKNPYYKTHEKTNIKGELIIRESVKKISM